MPSDIFTVITDEDIGKIITNEVVVATKKIYSNNGFVIFACEGGFTVKGNCGVDITVGAQYLISGKIGTYGRQFQVACSSITQVESDKNKELYIANFIVDTFPGVGQKTATKLAELYKEKVLFELLHNYKDAAKNVPGLSLQRAKECSLIVDENEKNLELFLSLRLFGLTKHQAEVAYQTFGLTVVDDISSNPYVLMRCNDIGFSTCESIAQSLGVDLLNELRFEGALTSVVEALHATNGDTYFLPERVKVETLDLLGVNSESFNQILVESAYELAVEKAVKDKMIVVYRFVNNKCEACLAKDEGARIASMLYFRMEAAVKREIEGFIQASVVYPDRTKAKEKIEAIANDIGITPDENQMEALIMCMYQPISIITGGPGTGKTTITGILAKHFEKENIKCEYCAPTGRAAKRLSDAAGVKANTIHRLLEMSADSEDSDGQVRFGRNANNPIDARVILVDEASMVDTTLFVALLSAMKKNASIILIGDPNQLPSVGAGNVLADLLSLRKIPRVCLEYVFRQSDESSIASNSCRILSGEKVIPNNDDFIVYETDTDEQALDLIISLYNNSLNQDCAILCPTKQNLLGTASLNSELQNLIIKEKVDGIKVRSDLVVYRGDRVMQIKNNYKTEYYDPAEMSVVSGIYNGEIGEVKDSDFLTDNCTIVFDGDRQVEYDKKMLADIDLAYAMTVHKAQGCEFDTVFVVLGKMNYKLSNRKLLYTAITRGKKKVVIIDSGKRLDKMIASNFHESRNTSLKDFLSILEFKYGDKSD